MSTPEGPARKKFADLRAQMSPEAQEQAREQAEAMKGEATGPAREAALVEGLRREAHGYVQRQLALMDSPKLTTEEYFEVVDRVLRVLKDMRGLK